MGTINEKISYLNETKQNLKEAINNLGGEIDNETTFREYAEELQDIYDNLPKTSYVEGSNISISNSLKGKVSYEDNKVVKGNTSQNTLTGKNLFPLSTEQTISNVKITPQEDGSLKLKGTASVRVDYYVEGTASNYVSVPILSEYSGNVTLSSTSLSSGVEVLVIGTSLGVKGLNSSTTTLSFSVTENDTYRLLVRIGAGVTVDTTIYVQLEKGSSATSFEQYCGGIPSPNPSYPQNINVVTGTQEVTISDSNGNSTTHTLHLGTLELCKIGDYQDYIYKDNGKWYKYGAIDKVILNGSEEQTLTLTDSSTNTLRVFYNYNVIEPSVTDISNFMCNRFQIKNVWSSDKEGIYNGGSSTNTKVIFRINKSRLSTVDLTGIRSWLSSNNVDFRYCLVTPTSTEITDTTLIQELEELYNMYSYSGTTNISISGNLPFIMKVRALKGN